MPTMKIYTLHVAGLKRQLPVVRISEHLAIASFVILGDAELVVRTAAELVKKIPPADYLLTAEAKGIPLVQEMARLLGMKRYFVARKNVKPYMTDPLVTDVRSITTQKTQLLCLDREESRLIHDKRIILVDDVISTGESLCGLEKLVMQAGGIVAGRAAILAEGDAAKRKDIVYLEELPLFPQ
jgi:adenine phosphoribosyltransferase